MSKQEQPNTIELIEHLLDRIEILERAVFPLQPTQYTDEKVERMMKRILNKQEYPIAAVEALDRATDLLAAMKEAGRE